MFLLRRLFLVPSVALVAFLTNGCRDVPVTEIKAEVPVDVITQCAQTPDCVSWIAYHVALKEWFDAVNLAAWYDGLVGGDCGGVLPPCYVMERESGGSLTAENPVSSAAGKWQMLIGTSNNVARAMGRYDLVDVPASHWTEAEQDEGARLLWNYGAGCSHWAACN